VQRILQACAGGRSRLDIQQADEQTGAIKNKSSSSNIESTHRLKNPSDKRFSSVGFFNQWVKFFKILICV
jgi:hypothetical protein